MRSKQNISTYPSPAVPVASLYLADLEQNIFAHPSPAASVASMYCFFNNSPPPLSSNASDVLILSSSTVPAPYRYPRPHVLDELILSSSVTKLLSVAATGSISVPLILSPSAAALLSCNIWTSSYYFYQCPFCAAYHFTT